LPGSSGNQLDRTGDDAFLAAVSYQKMDMVRGHHIVENTQPKPLFSFKQPPEPIAVVLLQTLKETLFYDSGG